MLELRFLSPEISVRAERLAEPVLPHLTFISIVPALFTGMPLTRNVPELEIEPRSVPQVAIAFPEASTVKKPFPAANPATCEPWPLSSTGDVAWPISSSQPTIFFEKFSSP